MIAGVRSCNRCNAKGFRFKPTDEELVYHHLSPKILRPHSREHYIGDLQDLRQYGPEELFRITQKSPDDTEGYFFCSPTKKSGKIVRKGKDGFWGETRGCVSMTAEDGAEEEVAKKRVFVFHQGVHPGERTAWFIHQFESTASLPSHQDQKEIFLCKVFEHRQKDRVSGQKRKAESNAQETSAKTRRAQKDDSFKKIKAKNSSAEEARLGNKDLASDANNSVISCEELHGSHSFPSDPGESITVGEVIPQSHHLPSEDNINNTPDNMHEGGHPWSSKGLHQSCGFPSHIQNFGDNQQSHHLPSNSTIDNISTYGEMPPSHHFPPNTLGEISDNEGSRYNARSNEGSHLSCHMPLALENDIISNDEEFNIEELLNDPLESAPPMSSPEEFNIEELLNDSLESAPPMSSQEVQSCNEFPPSTSDLNRGTDKFQNQRGNNGQEDDANFWNSLLLEDIKTS